MNVEIENSAVVRPYQALLVVSFGGPEGMDEVMPFLENVLRGTRVPRERMLEVAEHYRSFGGVSPINAQNRALIAALEEDFCEHGLDLPIYWGNRNWHPLLPDALRRMRDDGIDRALALFTSAYSSYSGCRQYRQDIERAREEVGQGAPAVEKVRTYFNHPGFIEANLDRVRAALEKIEPVRRPATQLLFTAHSIPLAMAATCDYERQLLETSRLVAEGVGFSEWKLLYQSRSGPPQQPWLEPDICDYLETLSGSDVRDVVISPIGFISDHLEVLYDLDTEARDVCEKVGVNMVRAGTAGTHPSFVRMVRDLVEERLQGREGRAVAGCLGPSPDYCPADCCRYTPGRPE